MLLASGVKGKGIQEILAVAKQIVAKRESGTLAILGGGNSLGELGPEKTAKLMIEGVKEIKDGKKDLRVVVVGIMRRPRESLGSERMRKEANKKVHEEMARIKVDLLKEKDIGVSFLDLDRKLNGTMFDRNLAHLNSARAC